MLPVRHGAPAKQRLGRTNICAGALVWPSAADPRSHQLYRTRTRKEKTMNKKKLTSNAGAPIADNQNVMTAGPLGPLFVQNWQLSLR